MREWRECKLGEVVEFNPSTLSSRTNWKFINYLDTGNITRGKINTLQRFNIESDKIPSRAKRLVHDGDIVYSTVRPNQEHYGLIKNPAENLVASTGFAVMRAKHELCDSGFIYRFLTQSDNTEYLSNVAEDSTTAYPSITPNVLMDLDILLPPLPEQKAIAEVLGCLDDKIDLLNRQNKTLEELAQAYFRQWFIEEAGEDWENGTLDDEFEIIMGQSPPGNTYNDTHNGLPFFQGRADFSFRFPRANTYCSSPQKTADTFDTLLCVRAPVGDLNMAFEHCCIGRGLAIPKHKKGLKHYTFYKMKSLQEHFYLFDDDGTVFGSLSRDKFSMIETIIPPLELCKKFNSTAEIIDKKIFYNSTQIRTLTSLRDTLLPKLISGEVRVKM